MTKLVDLKITKAERKEREERYKKPMPFDGGDAYPYESRLSLNDDMLEKLGIDTLPRTGKKVKIVAECVVTATSENQTTGGYGGKDNKNRSLTLQIRKLALDIDNDGAKEAIDAALDELKD